MLAWDECNVARGLWLGLGLKGTVGGQGFTRSDGRREQHHQAKKSNRNCPQWRASIVLLIRGFLAISQAGVPSAGQPALESVCGSTVARDPHSHIYTRSSGLSSALFFFSPIARVSATT